MGRKILFTLFLLCLLFIVRLFFYFRHPISFQNNFTGIISSVPEPSGGKQAFFVKGIQVVTRRYPEYKYGDFIKLEIRNSKSETNSNFQNSKILYPKIELIDRGKGNFILGQIYLLRKRVVEVYQSLIPEPEASLLSGIVLGVKSGLPYEFNQALINTGTVHVVVASGTNITWFLGFWVFLLNRFFNRRKALFIALFADLFYMALAGFQPPIVRAGIMGAIVFGAQFLGRQSYGMVSLAATGFIMVLISPSFLFDIGFQLSVAATAGLILISPIISNVETYHGTSLRWLKNIFSVPFLGEALSTTLAAQITTTPLILFYFGRISILSPLINMLVIWTIPFVMVLGGVIAATGLIFHPAAQFTACLTYGFLWFFTETVIRFGRMTGGVLDSSGLSGFIVIGYYLILIGVILKISFKPGNNKSVISQNCTNG